MDRYCQKCKINKLHKLSKTDICKKCLICSKCGKNISSANITGYCKNCLNRRKLENIQNCHQCGSKLTTKQSLSGLCKICYDIKRSSNKRIEFIQCENGCGTQLRKKYNVKKQICKTCFHKLREKAITKNCDFCNEPFKMKRKTSRFCSVKCLEKHRIKRKGEKELEINKKIKDYKDGLVIRQVYCSMHEVRYQKGNSCIKCDMDKQDEKNRKLLLSGKWVKCWGCNALIFKGKTRCRECIRKKFS